MTRERISGDRKQLERICRYLLPPPFAHDAITALPGDRARASARIFKMAGLISSTFMGPQGSPRVLRIKGYL